MIATAADGASMMMTMGFQSNHSHGQRPTITNSGSTNAFLDGSGNNNNNNNKRLASCREELERSWQGLRGSCCCSNASTSSASDGVDSGRATSSLSLSGRNNLRCISYDGPLFKEEDDEDDIMMMSADIDASSSISQYGRVVKRRRTLSSTHLSDEMDNTITTTMTTTAMEDCSFVRCHRISSTHRRPPHRIIGNDSNSNHHTPQLQQQQQQQVKAGWYDGTIDAFGNRHGKGITRHDDGTEYEGPYVNDVMEGIGGKYKFITERRLVPDPCRYGSTLHRQIEKSFEGIFANDVPHGAGMFVTKTVDCAPQVLGSNPPNLDIRFMEVVYDVGMYNHKNTAIGEGVRIIYSTTNVNGRSTLEKSCFRLMNGENTNMKVANDYSTWVCQCLGMADVPIPSFTM